jgi:putative FmdB family regulatory protein
MPIFEYECARCGAVRSEIVIGSQRPPAPACGQCGSRRTRRVMSTFAVVETEASRLQRFDPAQAHGESFYKDSRNVGLWAKKRARQMGVDLGPRFEATVEKARSGKLIKDML